MAAVKPYELPFHVSQSCVLRAVRNVGADPILLPSPIPPRTGAGIWLIFNPPLFINYKPTIRSTGLCLEPSPSLVWFMSKS